MLTDRGRGSEKSRATGRENVYSHTVTENAGVAASFDEQKQQSRNGEPMQGAGHLAECLGKPGLRKSGIAQNSGGMFREAKKFLDAR